MIADLFPVTDFCFNVIVFQGLMMVMVPPPMPSYFHSATKKILDHLRAWWRNQHMQFSRTQVMVQHLVMGMTSTSLTMPTVTLNPIHTLVQATTTPFQVEYKTSTQSWLGLAISLLMRWRCFIWLTHPNHPCTQALNSLII